MDLLVTLQLHLKKLNLDINLPCFFTVNKSILQLTFPTNQLLANHECCWGKGSHYLILWLFSICFLLEKEGRKLRNYSFRFLIGKASGPNEILHWLESIQAPRERVRSGSLAASYHAMSFSQETKALHSLSRGLMDFYNSWSYKIHPSNTIVLGHAWRWNNDLDWNHIPIQVCKLFC